MMFCVSELGEVINILLYIFEVEIISSTDPAYNRVKYMLLQV